MHVKKSRILWIDVVRGLTILSMIAYHGMWDLIHFYGKNVPWYEGMIGTLWEQSICFSFIFLAGFCVEMDRKPLIRGLEVLGFGFVITAISVMLGEDAKILFGVLTLLGSCILLWIPLRYILKKLPMVLGLTGSGLLFVLCYGIPKGFLGIMNFPLVWLPRFLYRDLGTTYVGFCAENFYSADYFPLLPWMFLFLCGTFLYLLLEKKESPFLKRRDEIPKGLVPLAFLGRHSLWIYLLHQPVLYVVLAGICR